MKNLILLFTIVVLLLPVGCTGDFDNINTDPNAITKDNYDFRYMFTASQVHTSGRDWEAWRNNLIYCSTMMQHLASVQSYWNGDNAIIEHNATTNDAGNATGKVLADQDTNAARLSQTLVDYLRSTNDPRLTYFGTVAANPSTQWGAPGFDYGNTSSAIQLGMPNGYDQLGSATDISNAANWPGNINNYSIVNRYTFARLDAPTFIHTYAEDQLLLAEAAYRDWISGDAETYYKQGVTAAMRQLAQTGASPGVSDAEITAYLTANPYDASKALELINTQYWIATFMDEYEAWANWRRSGYPQLVQVNYIGNVTNGTIPRRFTYPSSEASNNQRNYEDAVSCLNDGDKMTSRVWWDVAQ